MEVVIRPDPATAGALVADIIRELVGRRPDAVIGLATGGTPIPVYRDLVAGSGPDWRAVRFVMLDEYVGLPAGHPQSYRQVLRRELLDPLGVDPGQLHGPDLTTDPAEIGPDYEHHLVELGRVDLQILGIGSDGHVGFNEPGSSLASRTRWKTLTEQTRNDNARFFERPDQVPRHVITQGLGTIGDCGHAVLLATGPAKREAVAAAVEGPVSASCPASVLQFHPHATTVLDEEAAAGLARADYYRRTLEHKPSWQRH